MDGVSLKIISLQIVILVEVIQAGLRTILLIRRDLGRSLDKKYFCLESSSHLWRYEDVVTDWKSLGHPPAIFSCNCAANNELIL